jgi:alpha-amylase
MATKFQVKKPLLVKSISKKSFRTVPLESGFQFYTAIGNYTGVTATNLKEFAAQLQMVPIESVTFHFQRKDFQQWIKNTVKDTELVEQLNKIRVGLSAEDLRKEILSTVKASIA